MRTLQAEGWKGLQREGPQREGAARGRSLQEEGVVPGRWPRGTPTTQGRRCPQKVILLSRPHRTRRSSRAAETGPGGEEAAQSGGWVGTGRPNARRWQRSGPRGPPQRQPVAPPRPAGLPTGTSEPEPGRPYLQGCGRFAKPPAPAANAASRATQAPPPRGRGPELPPPHGRGYWPRRRVLRRVP